MAIAPTDNETFYREVDEELRRQQMKSFWQRYGIALAIGLALLLAAVAGYLWWRAEQRKAAEREAEMLVSTVTQLGENRPAGTKAKIDQLAQSPREGYRAAALFTRAGVHLAEGREPQAIATYREIATNDDFPAPYRDMALIRQTVLEYDRLQPAQVVARLRPLAAEGSPWRGTAGELVGAALMKQGKAKEAAPIFAGIAKDQTVPESIRARATQMAGSLGIDATEDGSARPSGAAKQGE